MTITVLDENDNTPTFERSYFNLTFEEDEEVIKKWHGMEGMYYKRERGQRERGDGLQGDIERGNMGISPCKNTTLQIEYQSPQSQ